MRLFANLLSAIGDAWCQIMHPDPMWPVSGVYQCRVCQRKFPVAWERGSQSHRTAPARPEPRCCRHEPPYPAHSTAMVTLADPGITVHARSRLCQTEHPHSTAECGVWQEVR